MNSPNITRIGKYEVIGVLGRGGMGLVYRAFDRHLGREVAIKTVTEGLAADTEVRKRFYREAAKTAMLKHPNIVIVYDLGEQDGFPFIVMEYLEGQPLDRLMKSENPLPTTLKLHIIEQVCSALGYAHRNDVIHRDVKPANVIVQPDGIAKLLDFGIARRERSDSEAGFTGTGLVIGTVRYMAPERLQNRPLDARSDIFSTGVMLFQLLTGHLPFEGDDVAVVQKILGEEHPPLGNYLREYPAALDAVIDRALAKDPQSRYAAADEMAAELHSILVILRKDQVLGLLERAERLVADEQYTEAKQVLLELVRIDSQHSRVRQLMTIVQQKLALRQRSDQIRLLRSQADEAALDKRFEGAIAHIEEALRLDPSDPELMTSLEVFRQKKHRREQVEGYLLQANDARSQGRLEQAQAIIAEAMRLDKEDSRLQAVYTAIVHQIEGGARQARARKLLDAAREQVLARQFTAALKILEEVEQVDASNPEVISLLNAARSGKAQEERRRLLEKLEQEIVNATTSEKLRDAAQLVNQALERMPGEPALLTFKAHLARQLRELEDRSAVEQAVQQCRVLLDSSPQEALDTIKSALRRLPGNERLLAVQQGIEERIRERGLEQARARYLAPAHEAIDNRRYSEAIRLLERCQAEGIFFDEISELLNLARSEAEHEQRQSRFEKIHVQVERLMASGDYDGAIELLTSRKDRDLDPFLGTLLEKAKAQSDALKRGLGSVLGQAERLLKAERYDEVLEFLGSLPPFVLEAPAIQEVLAEARSASSRDRAALAVIASTYAYLDAERVADCWDTLQNGLQTYSDSPLLNRMEALVQSRCTCAADKVIANAPQRSRTALAAGDTRLANDVLSNASAVHRYASCAVRDRWKVFWRKARIAKVFGRIGLEFLSRTTKTDPFE